MIMKKCLFISRPFLFENSAGGIIERAFVEGVQTAGKIVPSVYCADDAASGMKLAQTTVADVVATKDKKWVRIAFAGIRRVLPDLSWLPGFEWWSWGKESLRAIEDRLKSDSFDYIHTVSYPCASHWVGLKLKQKYGLPWVAQFYDPWADNPYRPFKTRFLKKLDFSQEREVVENADLIIHDNEAIADLWRERYGDVLAQKIVVLPLIVPMPKSNPEPTSHKNGEPIQISHIGNFMLNRTSEMFIRAMSKFLLQHPDAKNLIKVNYIGSVTETEKELIQLYELEGIFNLVGKIPPEECVKYYQNSDIFLAVDGVNNVNLFFPSKILLYFYYRKPVIGITPENSVLDHEMKKSGHASYRNDDVDGIVEYINTAVYNYDRLMDFDRDYWMKFTVENVVSDYTHYVDDFIG